MEFFFFSEALKLIKQKFSIIFDLLFFVYLARDFIFFIILFIYMDAEHHKIFSKNWCASIELEILNLSWLASNKRKFYYDVHMCAKCNEKNLFQNY